MVLSTGIGNDTLPYSHLFSSTTVIMSSNLIESLSSLLSLVKDQPIYLSFLLLPLLYKAGIFDGITSLFTTHANYLKEMKKIQRSRSKVSGGIPYFMRYTNDEDDDEDDDNDEEEETSLTEKQRLTKMEERKKRREAKRKEKSLVNRMHVLFATVQKYYTSPSTKVLLDEFLSCLDHRMLIGYTLLLLQVFLKPYASRIGTEIDLLVNSALRSSINITNVTSASINDTLATTTTLSPLDILNASTLNLSETLAISSTDPNTTTTTVVFTDSLPSFIVLWLPFLTIFNNFEILRISRTLLFFIVQSILYSIFLTSLTAASKQSFSLLREARSLTRQRRFLRQLLLQDKAFYLSREGKLDTSVLDDANAVDKIILDHLPQFISAGLQIFSGIVHCIMLDPWVAIVIITLKSPTYFGILHKRLRELGCYFIVRTERQNEADRLVDESFQNIDLIMMSAAEELVVRNYNQLGSRAAEVQKASIWPTTIFRNIHTIIVNTSSRLEKLFVILRGMYRTPRFTFSDWLNFQNYQQMIEYPIWDLTDSWSSIQRDFVALERYVKLRSRKPLINVRITDEIKALNNPVLPSDTVPLHTLATAIVDTAATTSSTRVVTSSSSPSSGLRNRKGTTKEKGKEGIKRRTEVTSNGVNTTPTSPTASFSTGTLMTTTLVTVPFSNRPTIVSANAETLVLARTSSSTLDTEDNQEYPLLEENNNSLRTSSFTITMATLEASDIIRHRTPLYCVINVDGQNYRRIPRGNLTFTDVEFSYPKLDSEDDSKEKDQDTETTTTTPDKKDDTVEEGTSKDAPKDMRILKGLTFTVPSGALVAFVGASGSGKTTIFRLLTRMFDVDNGSITIDGYDLRQYAPRTLRRSIGYVEQNPSILTKTVRENILFGFDKENTVTYPTDDQLIAASKMANIHDDIMKMGKGYDTKVNESRLSGGQKQRLAIARAIVRNPTILLLDEATSALDPPSEGAVTAALQAAMRGRTTFVIAHRLSTVVNADIILMLENGRIVEYGTHKELLQLGQKYKDFVAAQLLDAEGNVGLEVLNSSKNNPKEKNEDKHGGDELVGFSSQLIASSNAAPTVTLQPTATNTTKNNQTIESTATKTNNKISKNEETDNNAEELPLPIPSLKGKAANTKGTTKRNK